MERRHRFGTIVAAYTAAMILGCSGECPTIQECDIRNADCQRRTVEATACLRGGGSASPPIEVVDANAFIDAKVNEVESQPQSDELRDLRRGLALFDLAATSDDPTATVRDYWNNIAAFFSSTTGKVTILDRGEPLDTPSTVRLLVHELVHAMQHRDLGDDYYNANGSTYDTALVLVGVTEGEAVLYQDLATAYGYDRKPDEVDWDGVFRVYQDRQWTLARTDDSGFDMATLRFPYAFGGGYVNRAWRAGGAGAARDVVLHPPTSTRQMFSAGRSGSGAWKEEPNEVGKPVMPAEFEFVTNRHLGAWLFEIFEDFSTVVPRTFQTFRDSGFTGDVLTVFRSPATLDVTAVWRLRFDTAERAANLVSNLREGLSLAASQVDRDVVLVASTDETVPKKIIGGLTWLPSVEADYTEPTNPAIGTAGIRWACPMADSPL